MKTHARKVFENVCFQIEMLVFYPSLFINQFIREAFASGLEATGLASKEAQKGSPKGL